MAIQIDIRFCGQCPFFKHNESTGNDNCLAFTVDAVRLAFREALERDDVEGGTENLAIFSAIGYPVILLPEHGREEVLSAAGGMPRPPDWCPFRKQTIKMELVPNIPSMWPKDIGKRPVPPRPKPIVTG